MTKIAKTTPRTAKPAKIKYLILKPVAFDALLESGPATVVDVFVKFPDVVTIVDEVTSALKVCVTVGDLLAAEEVIVAAVLDGYGGTMQSPEIQVPFMPEAGSRHTVSLPRGCASEHLP